MITVFILHNAVIHSNPLLSQVFEAFIIYYHIFLGERHRFDVKYFLMTKFIPKKPLANT